MLTIGKVAARANVSADTLRYYEEGGLLAPAGKSPAGYRLYGDDAVRRVQFIKHAQQCGFVLAEIREMLSFKARADACCHDIRALAVEKKLELERRIKVMKAMSQALEDLIAICNDEAKPIDDCPILTALETSLGAHSQGQRKTLLGKRRTRQA